MSETRSHLYNQQEVNAIVAEKLEPLLDFGAWGGASSSVSLNRINRPFDNYPAPGAVLPLDA